MSKNVRVAVRVPEPLEKEFMQRVIADGYGMKGKSKWVAEAIHFFLELEDFPEYVEYGEELAETDKNKVQSFYFDQNLINKLSDATKTVRQQNPMIEGVRSLIVRSSIIQRLFRGDISVRDTVSRDIK